MHFNPFHSDLEINNKVIHFNNSGAPVAMLSPTESKLWYAIGIDKSVLLSFCKRRYCPTVEMIPVNTEYFHKLLLIQPNK